MGGPARVAVNNLWGTHMFDRKFRKLASSFVALFALNLAIGNQALAQTDDDRPAIEQALDVSGSPAIGTARWKEGDVMVRAAGLRESGSNVSVTTEDLWHIGSNTKSMTATLIARLVERGDIAWEDTIGQRLGSHIANIDPAYADMTFLHLLSHRAGIVANVDQPSMLSFMNEGVAGRPMPEQRLDYSTRVLTVPPSNRPGSTMLYSNAGYVVAGAMIEQATGESWEDLMHREVFEPLGMESAGFGAPGGAEDIDQPRGHRSSLTGLVAVPPGPFADNPPVMGPGGTVHLSLTDMALYLGAHVEGQTGQGGDYLSADSWRRLHAGPFGGDYALGWGLRGSMFLHAGSNTMWFAQFIVMPDENLAIAIVFNDGSSAAQQTVIRELVGLMR
jgi:D-alanyl-D-alanine carboxypeptidase